MRQRLSETNPRCANLALLHAESTDQSSLRRLAESTRVLITTVGPYLYYGEPLVAACAAAGTDYVDLTGEPEFVDRMYLRHHQTAVRTGARIVHACGFDSIPYDLGVYHTVRQLPAEKPVTGQVQVTGDVGLLGQAERHVLAGAEGAHDWAALGIAGHAVPELVPVMDVQESLAQPLVAGIAANNSRGPEVFPVETSLAG